MKAAVHSRYGPPDIVRVMEIETPAPKDGELLVRVHATTVNRTDCAYRAARPFFMGFVSGLRRPKATVLGNEFAGEVEAVGDGVTSFKVGSSSTMPSTSPDAGGMTLALDRLEEAGWVRRLPDPGDGRRVFIELTTAGHELAIRVNNALHRWERALGIGPAGERRIIRVLHELADALASNPPGES